MEPLFPRTFTPRNEGTIGGTLAPESVLCYHDEFGCSTTMSPIAKLLIKNFVPWGTCTRDRGPKSNQFFLWPTGTCTENFIAIHQQLVEL